jgi:MFS family permease
MEQVLGYGAVETGLAFLPANIGTAVFSLFVTKRLMARWGAQPMVIAGLLLVIASLALLAQVPAHAGYAAGLLAPMLLLGMGAGLFFLPSVSLAMSKTDPQDSGVASGLANVTFQIGAALGVALVAGVASSATSGLLAAGSGERAALASGYHVGFLVAAVAVVLALVVAAAMLRPEGATAALDGAAAEAARPQIPHTNWAVLGNNRQVFEPELAGVGRAVADGEPDLDEGDAA